MDYFSYELAGDDWDEFVADAKARLDCGDYDDPDYEDEDCPLDGDAESALASCGWGTDEDYGYYGGDGEY